MKHYLFLSFCTIFTVQAATMNFSHPRRNDFDGLQRDFPVIIDRMASKGSAWSDMDWAILRHTSDHQLPQTLKFYLDPFHPFYKNMAEWGKWSGWRAHCYTEGNFRYLHVFNSTGYLVDYFEDENRDSIYETHFTYQYDVTGNVTDKIETQIRNLNHSIIEDTVVKEIVLYDLNGRVVQESEFRREEIHGPWIENLRTSHIYNLLGKKEKILTQYNNDGQWTDFDYMSFEYNSDGLLSRFTEKWYEFDTTRMSFSYSAGKQLDSSVTWDWGQNSWQLRNKNTFLFYIDHLLLKHEIFQWNPDSSAWRIVKRDEYLYDSLENIRESMHKMVPPHKDPLVIIQKEVFSYNQSGKPDCYTFFDWDSTLQQWALKDSGGFSYNFSNPVSEKPVVDKARGITIVQKSTGMEIRCKINKSVEGECRIFDLFGRLVQSLQPHRKGNFIDYVWSYTTTQSRFACGIYMVHIVNGQEIVRQKVVLRK